MKRRWPILTTLGLVLTLAALGPDDPEAGDDAPPSPVGASFHIPYRLTDTNHYLVRVRINGKGPFNFLVDSGAPALYVGTEAAKAIDLKAAEDDYWTAIDSLDLEGGARLTDLKARVEDPFQLVGMNALGLPGASIDGILGFTILARFRLEFDPTKDRMTWTRIAYEPKEPFIPRFARTRRGPGMPAEVQAMQAMGPLMKLLAAFVGKQPAEELRPQGYLGIELEPAGGGDGVAVAAVLGGSPAAGAGVEPGDVLVALDGVAIDDLADVHRAVAKLEVGRKVPAKLRRGGETREITLTAAEGF
jgi:membrane-associated protease RseP (regulator of RpoE activity)